MFVPQVHDNRNVPDWSAWGDAPPTCHADQESTLVTMFRRRTLGLVLTVAIATCLLLPLASTVAAAPSEAQVSANRVLVERAVKRYDAAQERSTDIDQQMAANSEELNRIIAEENLAYEHLRARVQQMYRADDFGFLPVLLNASTFRNFMARWDLMQRIARRDAETLAALNTARSEAQLSAERIIDLQADQARSLDALADEVAQAREDLATSEAALADYEARIAASVEPIVESPEPEPTQQVSGSGAWLTAVASHYGRNFTGRGASGEAIGPYTMMVAHKTLPFGTLIEFEYNGKHAVAKVADRGPYTAGREFDLGPGVVRVLDFNGVHEVRYRIISQ